MNMDHDGLNDRRILTTEDRASQLVRWTAILFMNGTVIACALGLRLSTNAVDLSGVIGCSLAALLVIATTFLAFWGGSRGTWILDHHQIDYRTLTGRSVAIQWSDIEQVLFGHSRVIVRARGVQISVPCADMRRSVAAQAYGWFYEELRGAFDLSAAPSTTAVGKCRRALAFCATLVGGHLMSSSIMVSILVSLGPARGQLSEREVQELSAVWLFLTILIIASWWKLSLWPASRHTRPRWLDRLP